ncbi:MAG TPA: hypothetical protein VG435_14220 [Acidimicrobiales bacterium]|nr:hypothetical protein [Acidimicrobiales bacterium]
MGLVITLFILLIDASLHSRSTGQVEQISGGKWVDTVLPVLTSSEAEGQQLAAVWTNGLKTPPASVLSQMKQLATGAEANYETIAKLSPPVTLAGPAGLLEAALYARSKAAAELAASLASALSTAGTAPTTSTTVPATASTTSSTVAGTSATTVPAANDDAALAAQINAAGTELQVGDQTYQLFVSSLPASLGFKPQPSAWAADLGPYAPQAAQVFLTTLQNAASTTPVNQVKVVGITTNPAPVSTSGGTQVLPDATAMTLDVTVADTGNQPANNLTVTASIAPVGHGSSSVRDFVNLTVGQAYTISGLGPLNPPQGVPVILTVNVTGPGSTPLATQTLVFQMPAPPPPSTTTTTPPTTTTTGG